MAGERARMMAIMEEGMAQRKDIPKRLFLVLKMFLNQMAKEMDDATLRRVCIAIRDQFIPFVLDETVSPASMEDRLEAVATASSANPE